MTTEEEARLLQQARAIEARVGHPGKMWDALKERVQSDGVRSFRLVQDEWLRLMWTLDEYRRLSIPPEGMGKPEYPPAARLGGVYRSKGNFFAELLALLLQNRAAQFIRPRNRVLGYSQLHQIDLAWPSREVDVRVCAETKVTGGPAYGTTPSRSSLADFSNRRKELKFAATDLKLWRRQQETSIHHWGVWRANAPPKMYLLWAARLRRDQRRGNDEIGRLVQEARALVETYLEGAGLFAWEEKGDHYEAVPIPMNAQITDLDDVLYRIQSEIKELARDGIAPPPQLPQGAVIDVTMLTPDPED